MEQKNVFSDDRLLLGCVYCGSLDIDTRDHVPSKCLLDKPFPENLPVVGCCNDCNQSFSRDEAYLACLIECVLCGSTDPEKIRRTSVANLMKKNPALRARIEKSKIENGDEILFAPEIERVKNVLLKLARGHASFELSQSCYEEPSNFWWGPLSILSPEYKERFVTAHIQESVGEIGSRNMQRLQVVQVCFEAKSKDKNFSMLINEWVEVQENQYRYLTIHDMGEIIVRIVISEYLACEVIWDS